MTNLEGNRHGSVSNSRDRSEKPQEGWEATRALTQLATQFLPNKDDYLAPEQHDIGRAVSDDVRELFVSCDPAPAMLQQFGLVRPDFIAVHDIGTKSSRKLLAGIAVACGHTMQKLVIRRQGFGTALATIEFIELPGIEGRGVRFYTTETEADTASRRDLARVLLGHSRLAVVLVGALPAHALAAAMKPLREDITASPWLNQDMLLLPLASATQVAAQGLELARGTSVSVRTTPQVTSPADTWNFLSGSWHRLRERLAKEGTVIPGLNPTLQGSPAKAVQAPPAPGTAKGVDSVASRPTAAAQPMPMIPMPEVSRGTGASDHVQETALTPALGRYVQQISALKGIIACCVFDATTVRSVAAAGTHPNADSLARSGAALMSSIASVSRSLGLGYTPPDAAITLGAHFLVLRPLPKNPGLVLHAVLDKNHANLTLARLQIERTDAVFDDD